MADQGEMERRLISWQKARAKPDPAASPALAERR
jgi:hypothetical protein